LTARFFETGSYATVTKSRNPIQGPWLAPSSHTLADFTIGALSFGLTTQETYSVTQLPVKF